MRTVNYVTVDIYRAGVALFEGVNVTPIELSTEELASFGITTDNRRRDYLVTAADVLDILSNPWVPQVGDEIREDSIVSEVSKLGPMSHWKWTTSARIAMRVHTHVTTVGVQVG